MKSPLLTLLLLIVLCTCGRAQEMAETTLRDLSYRPEATDAYARERCKLDLRYPTDSTGFATIVYFHGGGLEFGHKHFLRAWNGSGIAQVSVNYRLSPRVKNPVYTEDAAAAVAWTMRHVADYGGDPERIYVAGHSAGGYLTSMLALDTTYLGTHGLHPDSLAGVFPFSGHTITHFTPRKEAGLAWNDVRVDRYAPIHHLRVSDLPIVLITGDRELELYGRYEETAYFWRMLTASGHERVELHELDGFDHGSMVGPAALLALRWIRRQR
ncbi:MAG: alpha/beta hydrolase [Bacteroidota bacterium]